MYKKMLLGLLFLISLSIFSFAEDPYEKMAQDLSSKAEGIKKIAIIPFSYADNTASTKDGSVISERLTMKFINLGRFEIIERSVLDKVLAELKLQNSGVIDSSSAKELGKVLGVDAIITGTLVPTAEGKIEVNARIIKTETAQAIGASQAYVVKDWLGGDVQQLPQKPLYQPVQQQPYTPTSHTPPYSSSNVKNPNAYGFWEVIGGAGSQTIDINFDNGPEYKSISASGAGPVGFRIGGFGKDILGWDFELSVSKHYSDKDTTYHLPSGYIDTTSFGFSGDLLFRTLTKVQFYLGLGLGLSINNIQSNTLLDSHFRKLDETSLGIIARVPIGMRINMDDFTFFLEYRAEINSTDFNGGYSNITNTLTFTGSRFVFGVGSRF